MTALHSIGSERLRRLLRPEPDIDKDGLTQREMRGCLAPFVLVSVGGWLIFVAGLLILEGFHFGGFDLGDGVLAAAVGATAIFGLLGIILRHYFPGQRL